MSVNYNNNLISVSFPKNKNLLVYAHPNDKISFDFDISDLEKEIINGDLIIRLLNGGTITVVNFGLMALDNKAPILEDINTTYNPFTLFDGYAYYEESGVSSLVISRQISSPDNNTMAPGEDYPTSKEEAEGINASSKEVGEFMTPEQSAIPEFAPLVQDYILKTFQHAYDKTYEVPIVFQCVNSFRHNEINSDILPVKLLLINPKVTPEYGTYHYLRKDTSNPDYENLHIFIGGGKLTDENAVEYLYKPEVIKYNTKLDKIYFDGPKQSNDIVRFFHVGVPSQTISITQVTITGLPAGIRVPEKLDNNTDTNFKVRPLGAGAFEITIEPGRPGGVEIPMVYPLGMGGKEGIFSAVGVTYEGVQTKTGDLVRGGNVVYFEFKPVRSEDDISNFTKFNTYTFSTLRDPLIIYFGLNSDVIKGGKGDYTYYGVAGDNIAYGGEATEIFHLGSGNNRFYAGIGNDTVDVYDVKKDNRLYLSDGINKADRYTTSTVLDDGKIWFAGKYKGKDFKSSMQDFREVYFDIGDKEQKTERDDFFSIYSTKNLKDNILIDLGEGNNTVAGQVNAMYIIFKVYDGGKNLPFIVTDSTACGAFIKWGSGTNRIIGSISDDYVKGINDNESFYFDGNAGNNTADYSDVTVDLIYDASTGIFNKSGKTTTDTVLGVQKIIGSAVATNVFYGSVYYQNYENKTLQADITYVGGSRAAQSTLSYERLQSSSVADKETNGVVIDMTTCNVTKIKTGGKDKFLNIDNLFSSNNNDTFIISSEVKSNNFNGLEGFNTIDYSKLGGVDVVFRLIQGASGTVTKGNGSLGTDTINNFRHFIGSYMGSNFILNDCEFPNDKINPYRFIVEGKGNTTANKVNYDSISGKNMELDLRLSNGFVATLYKGNPGANTKNQDIIGKDQLINIGIFSLTTSAQNTIYMYDVNQLNYTIDAGVNGNNVLSFYKSNSAVNIDFNNSDYKNNLLNIKLLKLSNANNNIIMGNGFFGEEIDGGEGVSSIDFSFLIAPIVTEIDLNFIELKQINIGSKVIKVKNFQHIKATNADDNFTIKFDLKDVNNLKSKDIVLVGGQGFNTITFKEVKDSGNAGQGLTIDLSSLSEAVVTDGKGNKILKFSEFEAIIGSQGNDTFILPVVSFTFIIDGYTNGPDASNAVSYQMYTKGVYITELVLSKFRNIQKIIGSQGNDFITLTDKTTLQVDGFSGFNSAIYKSTTGDSFNFPVNVDILDNYLSVIKNIGGSKLVDTLRKVNLVSFAEVLVPQGVTFTVKNKDNSAFTGDGKLFLSGSKSSNNNESTNKSDYSSLSEGVILNLDVQKDLPAFGYWINVDKGNNSIDYLKNISNIKLSDKSTVYMYNSIAALSDIKVLNIDGIRNSNLSFAHYISNVHIDVTKTSMKVTPDLTINFSGFTSYEGTSSYSFTSYFLSSDNNQYHFNGLTSNSTLSYKEVEGNIKVGIKSQNNGNYNTLTIDKTNFKDTAANITTIEGSKGSTTIEIEDNITKEMHFIGTKGASVTNFISYEKIDNVELLSFLISKNGTTVGRKGGLFNDKIVNFTHIKGSKGNTRFDIDNSIITEGVKYVLDGGSGTNSINLSTFNTDLTFKIEAEKTYISVLSSATTLLDIYNMHFIWGSSSNKNNFILGNIFTGKYFTSSNALTVYGSKSGNDVLDLKDTDKSLILEPLSGRISLNDKSSIILMAGVGISTINLGNGNHELDISSKVINTSWKVINGGTGKNSVSFEKMLSGISYDLDKGMQDIGITLTNFTGVTGSLGNDIFTLTNPNKVAIMINGNGGFLNILDFSKLNVKIKVDIPNSQVTRGNITDTVLNIQVFKTGSSGADFISQLKGSYQFIGDASATSNNVLSYAGIDENITFNFITQSIIKGIGNNYDKFQNIGKLIGGTKTNNFLFVTEGLASNLTTLILDGSVGTNNIVNLSQLKKGITFDIASKSFTVPYNNNTLTIKLENIHQVIGTAEADIFIFVDNVNNFMANGGINKPGIKDTIDLSRVTSGVIVDFTYKTISYGSNKNFFLNIDRFIGSNSGNNMFQGLSTNSSYDIDGGSSPGSEGNTINYSGASIGLALTVVNGKIFINKGGLSDTFRNIQNLTLTTLEDSIVFNEANDLNVYKSFKKIDGGLGNNTVVFTGKSAKENDITINLGTNIITIGTISQNLALLNFHSWLFNEGTKTYNIIVGEQGLNLNTIVFAKSEANGILNIKAFATDLSIIVDQDSNSTIIINPVTSTRTTIINLKNLVLGNQTYNFTYSVFDPNKFMFNVTTSENTSFNVDINYYNSNQTITFLNNKIQLGAASFQNLNNLSIGGFAGNKLNLELRESSSRPNNLIVHDIEKEKIVSFTSSIANSRVTFLEGYRYSVATTDSKALEVGYRNVANSEIILTKPITLAFSTFTPAIKVARNMVADNSVVIDLRELPLLNNGTLIKVTSNKEINLYINGSNEAFFTVDASKNIVGSIIGSIYNNDIFDVSSDTKISITENNFPTNSLIVNPTTQEINNKDYSIRINSNKITSSNNLLNISIAGNKGINRINIKTPNEITFPKYTVNISAYNNLEYVNVGRSAVVVIDFQNNNISGVVGTINLTPSTLGGQKIHMFSGKFNSIASSLTVEDALVKEGGNFLIRYSGNNNHIVLNNTSGNKVDFSTVNNFKLTVNGGSLTNSSDINSFSFGNYVNSRGFSLYISTATSGDSMQFKDFTLQNINSIHLQVTNASDKSIVNEVKIWSQIAFPSTIIDFGSFSNMRLPTYYQIPIYSSGTSSGLGGNYPALGSSEEFMAGYQNRVIFVQNYRVSQGNLFINGNNECLIQDFNNKTVRLIGVNYIQLQCHNYIKISELALAKPFIVEVTSLVGKFDLSNVRDGQAYSFKFFSKNSEDSKLGVLIYSTKNAMDKFSPKNDSSFKLYGSIYGLSDITLPSGKNYINIDEKMKYHDTLKVNGGDSDTTLIYNITDNSDSTSNKIIIDSTSGGRIRFSIDSNMEYYNINKIVVPTPSHPTVEFDSSSSFRKGNQAYTFDIDTNKVYNRYDGIRLVNTYTGSGYPTPSILFSEDKIITTAYSYTGTTTINPVIICKNFFLDRLNSNNIKTLTLSNSLDFDVINRNYDDAGTHIKTLKLIYSSTLKVIAPKFTASTNYNILVDGTDLRLKHKYSNATILIYGNGFDVVKLNEAEYQEHMLSMVHFLEYTQDYNKTKEYQTSIGGSKLINFSNVWENESQYLEYFNKNSTTKTYWNSLDERINSALEQKDIKAVNTNPTATNSEDHPNPDISSQLVYNEDMEETEQNTNHSSIDNISYEEEAHPEDDYEENNNNEEVYYTEEDNESDSINHSYTLIEESTSNNTYDLESSNERPVEFVLHLLLEYAKNTGEKEDNSYILDELGSDNVTSEVIEDMYQVDEANSMAYMVDTGSNTFFSDSNLENHNDTSNTQEQQKQNKF